jgi:hypothetical protein
MTPSLPWTNGVSRASITVDRGPQRKAAPRPLVTLDALRDREGVPAAYPRARESPASEGSTAPPTPGKKSPGGDPGYPLRCCGSHRQVEPPGRTSVVVSGRVLGPAGVGWL